MSAFSRAAHGAARGEASLGGDGPEPSDALGDGPPSGLFRDFGAGEPLRLVGQAPAAGPARRGEGRGTEADQSQAKSPGAAAGK